MRCDGEVVADHPRFFGRDRTIYDPWHYLPVLATKPGALRNGAPTGLSNPGGGRSGLHHHVRPPPPVSAPHGPRHGWETASDRLYTICEMRLFAFR